MVEASYPRRLRQRLLVAELREGSPSGRLEDRQVICRRSEGRRGERRYRALDRGLRTHARPRGDRRRGGERPAGEQPDGHELRSGPGFLFLETATQRGSEGARGDELFVAGA